MNLASLLLAVALLAPAGGRGALSPDAVEPPFAVAAHRVLDLDGDGRDEVVLFGRKGEIRVLRAAPDGGRAVVMLGSWSLPDPDHSLVTFAPVLDPAGPPQLVVADREGTRVHAWTPGLGIEEKGRRLARRARNGIRTSRPLLSDFVRDANGDGRVDLVLPTFEAVELWLASAPEDEGGVPGFRKTAEVAARIRISSDADADSNAGFLDHEIEIPDLDVQDVNGDGRPDLVVSESSKTLFHLQDAEGRIPREPSSVLDLDNFRDTTAAATLRPGRVLAGGDRARSLIRDLDDDGIPDYVVAHRRKVWVFHGDAEGPQFVRPTTILKTADDVTAVWLANLDDDRDVDLLLLKIVVPSIGSLLTGLLGSLEIDFAAYGYANEDGRNFERKPRWRRDLVFKLPSLGEILRDPESILGRFEEAGQRFRGGVQADFDGDGVGDVALLTEARDGLEVWYGRAEEAAREQDDLDRIIRRVLFEDEGDVWDLDRMVDWIGSLGAEQARRLTDGREPDRRVALSDGGRGLRTYEGLDLDGDGRSELLAIRRLSSAAGERTVLEFLELPRTPR